MRHLSNQLPFAPLACVARWHLRRIPIPIPLHLLPGERPTGGNAPPPSGSPGFSGSSCDLCATQLTQAPLGDPVSIMLNRYGFFVLRHFDLEEASSQLPLRFEGILKIVY